MHLLNILLPILYFVVVWVYGKAFFSDIAWAKKVKSDLLLVIVGLHFGYLLARTVAFDHPPVTTVFEIFTVLSFCIAAAYAFIERRSKTKETGYFILNIAFFFQVASSLFIKDLLEVPTILRSNWFGLHVTSALLGYAAITISAVYGFLYLMLYHQIKASNFGVIYKKLPNLETLEKMNFTAVTMAFGLLSLAIVVGFIWLQKTFADYSLSDPKLIGTFIVWAVYGIGILAKKTGELKGRKVMLLSVAGFIIAVFSMTVINMFFSGFHKFN